MKKVEKKMNNVIIGLVLGSALVGLGGRGNTKKGRNVRKGATKKIARTGGYLRTGFTQACRMFGLFRRKKKGKIS